jgi:hypothetical protein
MASKPCHSLEDGPVSGCQRVGEETGPDDGRIEAVTRMQREMESEGRQAG